MLDDFKIGRHSSRAAADNKPERDEILQLKQ